jgi:(p)ppGpp synthase/HD superfamily hydrolase
MNLIQLRQRPAHAFMVAAHNSVNQKRKYTGDPYWTHPEAVAEILIANYPYANNAEIDAALLHDVVEDVGNPELWPTTWHNYSLDVIEHHFGPQVALLVDGLTERSYPGLNRAERKALEVQRIDRCCSSVKTVKLCDLLHNTADITDHDPGFAVKYMREKRHLLDHGLIGAYPPLWKKADRFVKNYFKT